MLVALKNRFTSLFRRDSSAAEKEDFHDDERHWPKVVASLVGVIAVSIVLLGMYWSFEPDPFSVRQVMNDRLAATGGSYVTGSATTAALLQVSETLLDKPGGYLTNDIMPPGIYLDNMPNWEFGVLVQVRDFSRAFRESFSRTQSQSQEDPDLREAEPLFAFNNDSWLFPATESEYRDAIDLIASYFVRISDPGNTDAQFFARADNLATWLVTVESRLGSLSQRLSASVGEERINTDTAGDPAATRSTPVSRETRVKTPWLQIDDVFYEARGTTWALLHFLRAVEIDFADVLADKNATTSLRQIIRDLEYSQRTVWFPVILNGSGFGIFANHSLTMANYVSRSNAAIIDLRNLLAQG